MILGGGGGRGEECVKIVTNMRNEKYIICSEVFKNLSLFFKKSTDIFSMVVVSYNQT